MKNWFKNLFKPKRIGAGYLLRWHLIPRNRLFNIYLHKFIGNDDDRALHDHPWWSFSVRLKGQMFEYSMPRFDNALEPVLFYHRVGMSEGRLVGRFRLRSPKYAHRLALFEQGEPCWTLFITGPRIREWGFLCRNGWKHWTTMAKETGETIGGCE